MSELPYRPNVCMIVLDRSHRIFLGERHGEPGVWQLPQGGEEAGTSAQESVYRELQEELGAPRELFAIIGQLRATHRYDFTTVPPYAVGRWRGQAQTFWLVQFLGRDQDIKLDLHPPEFMAWRWCPLEEIVSQVEPKRRAGYEAPLAEVREYLRSLPRP